MKRNKGFTLAEVLITLVVIGIIAAITVPIVMANHRKQETSARLKKFYSSLSQAVRLAQVDNYDFIKDSGEERHVDSLDVWWNKYLNSFPVTKHENSTYKVYNPTTEVDETPKYIYTLNDGSIFFPYNSYFNNENVIEVLFDVNGEKGPNYPGRDVFEFRIQQYDYREKNIHFVRVCTGQNSCYLEHNKRENSIVNCKDGHFSYCGELLQKDGWEFKDDYPIRL